MNAFFETTNGFNFQIIDPLIESRGVRLTWFDCNLSPTVHIYVSYIHMHFIILCFNKYSRGHCFGCPLSVYVPVSVRPGYYLCAMTSSCLLSETKVMYALSASTIKYPMIGSCSLEAGFKERR